MWSFSGQTWSFGQPSPPADHMIYECTLDCFDGSDEGGCPTEKPNIELITNSESFKCDDGELISIFGVCNGTVECLDGTDENPCPKEITTKLPEITTPSTTIITDKRTTVLKTEKPNHAFEAKGPFMSNT